MRVTNLSGHVEYLCTSIFPGFLTSMYFSSGVFSEWRRAAAPHPTPATTPTSHKHHPVSPSISPILQTQIQSRKIK